MSQAAGATIASLASHVSDSVALGAGRIASAGVAPADTGGSTGEAVVFWIVGPIIVLAALGMVTARKAMHSAMLIAVVMVGLAIFYITLEAAFLGVVQVVVYTGAIMMLFLFVIMLIGVDASDSRVETIRGQRAAAILAGLGLGALLVTIAGRALFSDFTGMSAATPEGNVPAIANAIFERHVWAFEIVAVLLITAAIGAMVLTHRERMFARPSQRELAEQRFESGSGIKASPPPNPGVFARHNAVDTPGLLPDGSVAEDTLSKVLVARGTYRASGDAAHDIEKLGIDDPGAFARAGGAPDEDEDDEHAAEARDEAGDRSEVGEDEPASEEPGEPGDSERGV
jgi:NADH-quinone oxidoreductase subunit J